MANLEIIELPKRPAAMESKADEPTLLLPVKVAAKLLGVTAAHVYELCAQGVLPSVRVGRRVMVNRSRLEQWVEENTRQESTV